MRHNNARQQRNRAPQYSCATRAQPLSSTTRVAPRRLALEAHGLLRSRFSAGPLVSRVRSSFRKATDALEDVIGRLGPDEGPWVLVVDREEAADGVLELLRAAEDPALELLLADEIRRLESLQGSELNEAKKVLATEATTLCHGREAAIEAAKLGAFIEFVGGSLAGADANGRMDSFADAIRKIGPEFCILSSDLGQRGNALPPDGFGAFLAALRMRGFSDQEIGRMSSQNPSRLLGLK